MKTTIGKIAFLCIVFTLLSFQILAESMSKEIEGFVNDLQIKPKSVVVIGEITHLHTGKKWELSQKIKNILVHALGKRFSVMDRSLEKSLKQEREKSISGYSILATDYHLTGTYEIKKEVVQIELKILSVDTSELVASKTIIVDRSLIEIYLRDYSEQELDLIIDKQNREIRSLLKIQEEQREKVRKLQEIRDQKEKMSMINRGEYVEEVERPKREYKFPKGGKRILAIGGVAGIYGAINHAAASSLRLKNKEGAASIGENIGNLLYLISAVCFGYVGYKYYSSGSEQKMYISASPNKITFFISKRF